MNSTLQKISAVSGAVIVIATVSCTNLEKDTATSSVIQKMSLEEKISQLMDDAPQIERLGVQGYNWWNEGLHGAARAGYATVFPQAIGLAATWDAALVHDVARTVAVEARAKFNSLPIEADHSRYFGLTIWSPNVNIFRDPRWGRGQETYGEDPYLTGDLATSFIRGLQGPDPKHPMTIASVKHLAVHSGPEGIRHGFNAAASPYDLEATYLPAFRQAVVEGKSGSVMCAYNAINGTPACGDADLIDGLLRDKWGFEGYVVTDCGAVYDMTEFHHYRATEAGNAAEVINAGVDLNCGTGFKALGEAVERGLVQEATIDRALTHLWGIRKRLGLDGEYSPHHSIKPDQIHTDKARELALRAAHEAIVLLKNKDNVLPLDADMTLAVIGPNADIIESLRGNYHGVMIDPVTPLQGLRETLGTEQVVYAQGSMLADGVFITIPETALRTENGNVGLKGEYFANGDFNGKPVLTRYDRVVNLDLQNTPPLPSLADRPYSIRWSGLLTPPAPGEYELSVQLENCWECAVDEHDTVQLLFNNQKIIAKAGANDPETLKARVVFEDITPHPIQLDFQHLGDWGIRLQWRAPRDAQRDKALAAINSADAVVAFMGLSPDLEGEQLSIEVPGFDRGDRVDLGLPAPQQALLEAAKSTGKPLIIVVMSGSAVAVNWAEKNADAVLQAWYPGEAGGVAIANTLLGKNNPSGRLPVTVYKSKDDLPPFDNYSMAGRTYRYFTEEPLYSFGYGLSYTEFSYSGISLSSPTLNTGDELRVSATIANTGDREGEEVVQLYLAAKPHLSQNRELTNQGLLRELAGFKRVKLAPGESTTVQFELDSRQLSTVDADGNRAVLAGSYDVFVGGSQPGYSKGVNALFKIESKIESTIEGTAKITSKDHVRIPGNKKEGDPHS